MKHCSIEDCDNRSMALSYCRKHYRRNKKYGSPNYQRPKSLRALNPIEYGIWYGMKRRCYNPTTEGYHRYGGRGITVCEEWLNSFEQFLNDVGKRPSPELSLDRKDNDGNYEPENVRWTTRQVQTLNRRPMAKSGYKGVSETYNHKWTALIMIKSRGIHIGTFSTKEEAARAWNTVAKGYYGENAYQNPV